MIEFAIANNFKIISEFPYSLRYIKTTLNNEINKSSNDFFGVKTDQEPISNVPFTMKNSKIWMQTSKM